jgi:hypothetical protein
MPAYIDAPRDKEVDFTTIEELRAVPFVKRWLDDGWTLCLSKPHLMAEKKRKCEFWVIGILSGDDIDGLGLPEWKNPTRFQECVAYVSTSFRNLLKSLRSGTSHRGLSYTHRPE